MWISSLKWGKTSKLTLVFLLLHRADGWETPHRRTTYFKLLHVSSKAGLPGSSLSRLVLLMKLQVYCEYIPVLVSMCPEITVKQWEVSGLSDTTFKYCQQAHRPKLIFNVSSQSKETFHCQVGWTFCSISDGTSWYRFFSSHFTGKFHPFASHKTEFFIAWIEQKSSPNIATSPLGSKWLPQQSCN